MLVTVKTLNDHCAMCSEWNVAQVGLGGLLDYGLQALSDLYCALPRCVEIKVFAITFIWDCPKFLPLKVLIQKFYFNPLTSYFLVILSLSYSSRCCFSISIHLIVYSATTLKNQIIFLGKNISYPTMSAESYPQPLTVFSGYTTHALHHSHSFLFLN